MGIEKQLQEAGYKLLGDDKKIEKLISGILKTKNIRYLKAIPFLLYKHDINIQSLKIKNDLLNEILDITRSILTELNLIGDIPKWGIEKAKKPGTLDKYYTEFKQEFELQLKNDTKPNLLIDSKRIDEERNLQFSLSQLFTRKEIYIIKRLQEGKPISRTDYEYYSRKTRKKLRSIINLHDFALNINAKTPAYDTRLFELKRRLEDWLLRECKISDNIEMFHISDNNIIISTRYKSQETATNVFKLSKIKDKKIISLLSQYKEHDFT